MATKSFWFYCGACGFKNHPRINGREALESSRLRKPADTAVCEQCGEGNSHPEAVEAKPNA